MCYRLEYVSPHITSSFRPSPQSSLIIQPTVTISSLTSSVN